MGPMFEWILMTYYQVREAFAEGGVRNIIHKRIFLQRTIIPVEMDLSRIPMFDGLLGSEYQFIELKLDDLRRRRWFFKKLSRGLQASFNLKKGWRGFALIKNSTVVGDIWCITPHDGRNSVTHPDLKLLGISCGEKEAYGFNMVVDPAFRGKNLAVPILRSLHSILKKEGYEKVYGAYWEDNLPALWMHRVLSYKELPKRRASRFFFIQRTQPY